ncbi:Predicted arabinose efflux permease, MFS family [Sphingobacterium nematocida]|uniref:Predicted arabinose efflux permease, MFS family n=1 Tax=Sphingobacterium nematocida TaxID=1513896 RepID=A0A1T5GEZ4_9SPHI|nr:MFS transporter [Sphingobacterium nematocida]SKC06942.1 Predicted arabinose efflux permease, MFS family [Sphingobacterium nematocida]
MRAESKGYAWLLVGLLWVVAFLNYFDRILITSMRDPIVADFNLNDAQFGLLTSVFLWSYGFVSPFGGFLADRYSRKLVIVVSVFIWSAVTLWTGYVKSFEEMLVTRVLMGISEACYIPAALALITDYHTGKTRSLATGLHMCGLYTGLALGGLGGFIAEYWGWRYGFHVFGLFGVLYALILVYFIKDKKVPEGDKEEEKVLKQERFSVQEILKSLFRLPSFYIILVYFAVLGMANWFVNGWLPTFLKEQFRLDLGTAGISATGYMQVGSFLGVILGGIIADRWVQHNPKGRVNVMIIGFCVGAPFLFIMASTEVFGLAIVAMLVFGLARGFNDANLMPLLRQVVDQRYIATAYGFLNFLSTIVGGLMVYMGGALKDAEVSLSIIYQIIAVVLLVASLSLIGIRLKQKS